MTIIVSNRMNGYFKRNNLHGIVALHRSLKFLRKVYQLTRSKFRREDYTLNKRYLQTGDFFQA